MDTKIETTLFAPIIVKYFQAAMDLLVAHSQKLDNGYLNMGRKIVGVPRNSELSKAKQQMATDFKETTLPTFLVNQYVSDKALFDDIIKALGELATDIITLCNLTKYNLPDTTYGPKIHEAIRVGNQLYAKFSDFGLLDIQWNSNDPFSCVLFCAANYLGDKETAVVDGWFAAVQQHPMGGNGAKLDSSRAILLKNIIYRCILRVEACGENKDRYQANRIAVLEDQITILLNTNEKLSTDPRFSVSCPIPLQISIFCAAQLLGQWQPSEGSLTNYMLAALNMIASIAPHERVIVVLPDIEAHLMQLDSPFPILATPPPVLPKRNTGTHFFPVAAQTILQKNAPEPLPPLPPLVEKEIMPKLYGMLKSNSLVHNNVLQPINPLAGLIFTVPEPTSGSPYSLS